MYIHTYIYTYSRILIIQTPIIWKFNYAEWYISIYENTRTCTCSTLYSSCSVWCNNECVLYDIMCVCFIVSYSNFSYLNAFFNASFRQVWIIKVLCTDKHTYVHAYICTDVNTHLHAYIWYIHAYTHIPSYHILHQFFDICTIFLLVLVWHSSAPYPTDCTCATEHIQWTTLKCNHYYSIDSEVVFITGSFSSFPLIWKLRRFIPTFWPHLLKYIQCIGSELEVDVTHISMFIRQYAWANWRKLGYWQYEPFNEYNSWYNCDDYN